jgi:predicted chitinase
LRLIDLPATAKRRETMTIRQQLFTLLRNLRWIIAICAVISLLLYLPDQIRELYRIAAADAGWITVKEFIAIMLIAIVLWLGAFQLTTESMQRIPAGVLIADRMKLYARLIPIALGASPILAALLGQLAARPGHPHLATDAMKTIEEVGSIFRIQARALASDRMTLLIFAAGFLLLLALFIRFAWRASGKDGLVAFSARANETYFSAYKFLALTIAAIAILTAAFIEFPAGVAPFVGCFGVIALFTICVTGFTIHLSLFTIRHDFPILPALLAWAFLVGILATNDDHEARTLPADPVSQAQGRGSAAAAFESWIKQPARMTEATRLGEYPVFVVSAQGGGIYAADNAAKFLARMQDLCPAFRQHLFAVSSVSGGSVGAAVFAAALHAEPSPVAAPTQACPRIAEFLAGIAHTDSIDVPGAVEQRVDSILQTDLLSPLTAGFLFPDFSQMFWPLPVASFDRARFLEYTLEDAADDMLANETGKGDRSNLLKADFQSHWAADNDMPALLVNTTDVGSGKRVIIAPFDIDPQNPRDSSLCMLANLKREGSGADTKVTSTSLHIPLSTAAFMSARFPWVTPATTVTLKENDCITENPSVRLVDGGYVENSGVETALDLIEKMKDIQATTPGLPKFRIYLMSLASGDFPDHGTFSLGEVMEPVRALLSTRSSRTYIALNRAARDDRLPPKDGAPSTPSFDTFGRTDISSLFYNLPLGWTLSEKTGDIVSLSSGRFWDCLPNSHFVQARAEQSNADCLQIRVFHLLNGSVASAFQTLKDSAQAETFASYLAGESEPKPRMDPQRLLACYESKWFQERRYTRYQLQREEYRRWRKDAREADPAHPPVGPYRQGYLAFFQTEQVEALLREWDRLNESDPRILAYVLGSVSYDSSDFARKSENFSFSRKSQIPSGWSKRIDKINAALTAKGQPPIDITSLFNRPEPFANLILGFEGNSFGNMPGTDDGWQFRPRGMYQLVGREQYTGAQQANQTLGQLPGLDMVTFPDALWNTDIAAKVAFAHFRTARYQGKTLFDLLNDKSLDFAAVRAFQKDMEHAVADQAAVSERSNMFQGCIAEASAPPQDNLMARLLGRL